MLTHRHGRIGAKALDQAPSLGGRYGDGDCVRLTSHDYRTYSAAIRCYGKDVAMRSRRAWPEFTEDSMSDVTQWRRYHVAGAQTGSERQGGEGIALRVGTAETAASFRIAVASANVPSLLSRARSERAPYGGLARAQERVPAGAPRGLRPAAASRSLVAPALWASAPRAPAFRRSGSMRPHWQQPVKRARDVTQGAPSPAASRSRCYL